MSDFHAEPTHPTARKRHRCIACLHWIVAGETYVQQEGRLDGHAYRNRYHRECWDAAAAALSIDEYFVPGEFDPPARLAREG